jgi:uncharacterized membrane protein
MKRYRHGLLFFILLICVGIRSSYLDKGYNSDELWLLEVAKLDFSQIISFLKTSSSMYPPLSAFLMHLWLDIGVMAEWWQRLFFVIFGFGLCIIIYLLGKTYINKEFGLLVLFLSSISPLLVWSSQFIRGYVDSAFWASLSTLFLVRILKSQSRRNFLWYIIFSVLAIYSSYINLLVLGAHAIFILFFYYKNLSLIRRPVFSLFIIGLSFLPGLSLLDQQLKFAKAIDFSWAERGFRMFGLNFGYYARSIAATFGFDPDFLAGQPLAKTLSHFTLILLSLLSLCIFIGVLVLGIIGLRNKLKDKKLAYFFPILVLTYLVLYNSIVQFLHFPSQPEYCVSVHVLFIFVLAGAIYSFKNRWLRPLVSSILVVVFITRWPQALSPEFETKKSAKYILSHMDKEACLLMVRNTNFYLNSIPLSLFILEDFLRNDPETKNYKSFDASFVSQFEEIKKNYKDVWFYRVYGNDEILGANRLIMDWLQDNGYQVRGYKKFKRIDVINYRRRERL